MNTNQKVAASSRTSAEIRRCSSCRRGGAVIFPEWALVPGGPGGHCRYCRAPATEEQATEMAARAERAKRKRLNWRGAS